MAVTLETDPATGAELKVETGTGHVERLDHKPRNVQVVITSDNPAMRKPVTGWADGADNGLVDALCLAESHRTRVEYRIEVKRKSDVDPALPFEQLTSDQKVRDFVSLKEAPSGYRGAPETAPQAKPDEAPPHGDDDGPPAGRGTDVCSGCGHARVSHDASGVCSLGNCEGCLRFGVPSHPEERAAAVQRDVARTPEPNQPTPQVGDTRPSARPGVKVQEDKPWEPYNSDGSLNCGSYAFATAQRAVSQASRLWRRWLQEAVTPFDSDEPEPGNRHDVPDPGKMKALARQLLLAADEAQANVRVDGHYDRMDNSHAKALNAVVDATYCFLPPFGAGGDLDVIKAWRAQVVEYATAMLMAARLLTEEAL